MNRLTFKSSLWLVLGVILFAGCQKSPRDTVDRFVDSYNRKDINSLMSCLDPTWEKAYCATSNILSGVIGVKIEDVVDLLPALSQIVKATGDMTDVTLHARELSATVDGNLATVAVELTENHTDAQGNSRSSTTKARFFLKKFDDEWRIIGLK